MIKTHFNDTRPNDQKFRTACPDCRCHVTMIIEHYPHGPNKVGHCPVCGTKLEHYEIRRLL